MSAVPKLRFPEFRKEWTLETLENSVSFRNGKAHEKDIDENGRFVVVNSRFVSTEGRVRKFTNELVEPLFIDEIVMVMSDVPNGRALAKCFLVDKNHTYSLNQRICAFTASSDNNPQFLFNVINRNPYYLKFDSGVTQTNLRKQEVLDCPLKKPTLSEQKKIADFLGTVDKKIAGLRERERLLTHYKKGVMQKIFTQTLRFKQDNGSDFPDWEERRVDHVFSVTRGNVLAMSETRPEPTGEKVYPVYSSQTKKDGLAGYYNEYLYEDAITWTTDGANAGETKFREGKFYCTNVCGVLLSDEGFANAYVAAALNAVTRRFVSYVGNPKLMNNVMGGIKIDFPCVDEQQKIADFLSAIDDKITAVSSQITQMQDFKKGLLQQMFV